MADEKTEKPRRRKRRSRARAPRRAAAAAAAASARRPRSSRTPRPSLRASSAKYKDVAIPALIKQFGYTNPNQVPRLEKIVVNMGLGAAVTNPKIIDTAVEELRAVTGQKPVVTRSKKAIASFKLRAGLPIGAMVTLRKAQDVGVPRSPHLDRAPAHARLPRRLPAGFDGQGNYTLGLKEQIIFPEIDYDRIDVIKGLNVSFVTTANTDEEGRALLQHMGMPFRAT